MLLHFIQRPTNHVQSGVWHFRNLAFLYTYEIYIVAVRREHSNECREAVIMYLLYLTPEYVMSCVQVLISRLPTCGPTYRRVTLLRWIFQSSRWIPAGYTMILSFENIPIFYRKDIFVFCFFFLYPRVQCSPILAKKIDVNGTSYEHTFTQNCRRCCGFSGGGFILIPRPLVTRARYCHSKYSPLKVQWYHGHDGGELFILP